MAADEERGLRDVVAVQWVSSGGLGFRVYAWPQGALTNLDAERRCLEADKSRFPEHHTHEAWAEVRSLWSAEKGE